MSNIEMDAAWTTETYVMHNEAMRIVNDKLQEERFRHLAEVVELNDRRYGEVGIEKEKALKIKEIADLSALELARESQVYKDERNDAMREQNLKDNGIYATRDDLAEVVKGMEKALKPLVDYVSGQQGSMQGSQITIGKLFAGIGATGAIVGILVFLVNNVLK